MLKLEILKLPSIIESKLIKSKIQLIGYAKYDKNLNGNEISEIKKTAVNATVNIGIKIAFAIIEIIFKVLK